MTDAESRNDGQALKFMDQLCDRFESDLQAGDKPVIGDYLAEVDSDDREQLFVELFLRIVWT